MTDLWTCGHRAGAMCAECYRELARKAGELAEEGRLLREELVDLRRERDEAIERFNRMLGGPPR